MLHELINPVYLNERVLLGIYKKFKKAKPYPHFVLKNFFIEKKFSKLRRAILNEKFEKIDRDLFSLSHTMDLALSSNQIINKFYSRVSSKEFIFMMRRLTGENLSEKIDMQAHIMKNGDYLLFHDDELEGRKIAYVIYLSQGFRPKDGGRLKLYDAKNPLKPVKSIVPLLNSFVCFKVSKKSLHAVEEVKSNRQRLTVGGWFYGN